MRTLYAFPNTGHQIIFFPLACDDRGLPRGFVELPTLDKDSLALVRKRAAGDDWATAQGKPWLLGRFGTRKYETTNGATHEVMGFWCAVDVNIGTPDRGYSTRAVLDALVETEGVTVGKMAIAGSRNKNGGTKKTDPDQRSAAAASTKRKLRDGGSYIGEGLETLGEEVVLDLSTEFDIATPMPDLGLRIVWVEAAGKPVKVDLMVDFGNSRTVVLALEKIETNGTFASICRPILFPGPGWDVDSLDFDVTDFDSAIPDSWFTLMETVFPEEAPVIKTVESKQSIETKGGLFRAGKTETRVKKRTVSQTSHLFREISPAIIGPAATDVLSTLDVEGGGLSFLSSPKRYLWDDAPTGQNGMTHWTMNRQSWRERASASSRLVPLSGEITRFMPHAGAKCDIDSWSKNSEGEKTVSADHSRSDALVWVSLAIIEQAARQIQSEKWRQGNQPFLNRELGDIFLTYPAGWTEAEIDVYRQKWEMARDIFALSRLEDPKKSADDGQLPNVLLELDEAVAPQLAIVFSEMHHMRDYGENWIELYGRVRDGVLGARVMTIDIGGGTTDTSVVEYRDELPGVGVDLSATLLFKDSTIIAGDRLVRDIVERVLLPLLGQKFVNDPKQKELFERLFFTQARREGGRAQWSIITRTVIIPIIHQWLRCLSAQDINNPVTGIPYTPLESGAAIQQIERLNSLAKEYGLSDPILGADQPLSPDLDAIRAAIHDWFLNLADAHARYFSIFECDLVILTGKPSELPEIRELLEKRLPILPNRIVSAKGYFAGDWLPLSEDGRIGDAKLVTALGMAVYRGVQSGLIGGWRIKGGVDSRYRGQNYWGRIAGRPKPFLPGDILLNPDEETADVRLLTGSFIGRARFLNHVLPEQVYHLEIKGEQQIVVDVKLRRHERKGNDQRYTMSAESLSLESARNVQTGKDIPLSEISLKLCTLPRGADYWQDTGRFEVRWPV